MQTDSKLKVLFYKLMLLLPDKWYIMLKFYKNFGRFPNLKNPVTFSEKIQWLKIHDRNPLYTTMVDKYEVKKYVADIIGEEYIIPTLGVWDRAEDIDFDALPNQFVLKATHDSGRVIICRDKSTLDYSSAIEEMKQSLKRDFYSVTREWPYKNVPRRIIAEQLLVDESGTEDIKDYKFFCFNGEPVYCQVIRDRHSRETIDFYDMNWAHQEFCGLNPLVSNGLTPVVRPASLEMMRQICKKLARVKTFIRIDLYEVRGKVYFGEITFYPMSGMGIFTPDRWNLILGGLIHLPKKDSNSTKSRI